MDPKRPPNRGASRFSAGIPAVMHYRDHEYPCRAGNLSRSGALLEGEIPCPDSEEVRVTLYSAARDIELTVLGRVRRLEPEEGVTLLGLEFLNLPTKLRDKLDLLISRVVEGVSPAPLAELPDGATPPVIREALSRIPLPHRLTLAARATQAKERETLMHDPSIQVLDALARNPNLVLPEVRQLLKVRPLLPTTLDVLGTRWSSNLEIRLAIASHPSAPLPLVKRLVDKMPPEELRRLIQMPGVNPNIRLDIGSRLKR